MNNSLIISIFTFMPLLIFIVFPLLGYWLFTSIFDAVVKPPKPSKDVYITHHHYYYDNRQVHINQQTKDQEHLHQ